MAKQIDSTYTIHIFNNQGKYYIEASGSNRIKVDPQPFNWAPSQTDLETIEQLINPSPFTPIEKVISPEQLTRLGQAMYHAVFIPPVERAFGGLSHASSGGDHGVRIKLVIEPSDLARLPWELMHDGQDFIALRSNYPLVRGITKPINPRRSTAVRGPLKILYAWANPTDVPQLDLEKSALAIKDLLASNKRINFKILSHATVDKLRSELDKDYHILCLAAHGNTKNIYLEPGTPDKQHEEISVETLSRMLEGKNETRMVFLAACESGGLPSDGSAGFAQSLSIISQVPTVLAMQYEVEDKNASRLSARFFESLAAFRPVDAALSEARKSILDQFKVVRDVFAPVLFLQGDKSNLFQKARNWLAITFGIAFILAVIIGCFAIYNAQQASVQKLAALSTADAEANARKTQQVIAQVEKNKSDSLTISSAARQALKDNNPDLAISLAYFSNQLKDPPPGAQQTLMDIAFAPGVITKFDGQDANFSPDGKSIIIAKENSITLWDLQSKKNISQYTLQNSIKAIDISRDNKSVLIAFEGNSLINFDYRTGEIVRQLGEGEKLKRYNCTKRH